jgi:hypothetical protein
VSTFRIRILLCDDCRSLGGRHDFRIRPNGIRQNLHHGASILTPFLVESRKSLCILQYGGSGDSGDSAGLIPRVTSYLFERIESGATPAEGCSDPNSAGMPVEYTIKCSSVEIYNEVSDV